MKNNHLYHERNRLPFWLLKTFRIMKISVFLFFAGIIYLYADNSYSQETKLSIDQREISVNDVLLDIEDQSEFYFLYSNKLVDVDRKVNIRAKDKPVGTILDHLFADTDIRYVVYDRQIILSPEKMLDQTLKNLNVQQQEKEISGTVTDEYGQSLPGVTIMVEGTTIGTISDAEGKFQFKVPESTENLQFSFVGMKTQLVSVIGLTQLSVVMEEDAIGLEEVVTVGYGTQKKVNITGSVATVPTEELENRPLPMMGEVLRGVSPNLNIGLTRDGGEPGASSSWNIRGLGSLSGNDSPLILVDGVQMNINNIDPSNVESVSVLKDASASAIYGARAPFGVILITTKKGRKDGGISVEYNNNIAFGTPIGIGHLESSMVYATVFNQASINAGKPPIYDDDYLARIQGFIDGTYLTEYDPAVPPHNIWAGRRVGNANYDWPYEWVKKNKVDQKHNINISGGDKKTQYYTSLGYFNQDGFYNYGYDDYKRIDFLFNIRSQVTKWLSFNVNSKFTNSNTDYPHGITTVNKDYLWTSSLYSWSPLTPKYNINGSIANPWIRSQQSSGRIVTKTNDLLLTVGTEIEPVKGWKTNISYTYNIVNSYRESNPKPVWVELGTGEFGNVGKPNATYSSRHTHSPYSLFNAITSYEKLFSNHYFKVLLGYEQEEKFYSALYGAGGVLISEVVPSISTSLGAVSVDDTKYDWATQGIFGRLNYNFKEKYLIEFSARYNGSSRFDPESRWGFFPSGSIGYQISKENFWSPIEPYVNTLKFRASYGSLGNQNVASYQYISSVPVYSETPWIISDERPSYARTPGLISESLTWETVTTANFGVDAVFFNNRLGLNFDWFNRTTSEMFGPAETLPYTLGASAPKANNAKLETNGFEIILSWRDRVSSDFSYNVQFSIGDAKSTILEYVNESEFINGWYAGKEVGEIWGYITDGLIQTEGEDMPDQSDIYSQWGPGDMKYKDLNGDGLITTGNETLDDHGDLTVIGNTTPRYNTTISGGFNWKGFDFSMQWFGYMKRDYNPSSYNHLFNGLWTSWANSSVVKGTDALDYWRPADETNMLGPNTDAYFAKPYFSSEVYKNAKSQSRYVLNAGFMRLKFIQLGYTVPQHISKKVALQKARIFISGANLITFKSLPEAMDPESGLTQWGSSYGASYPISRTFSIGVNLTF
ncbi:MAG: TonB-dependent receptor [Bacteroidales bacterium]|nr:TonB-dependent receptor [Bacteroidales bacterium]